MTKSTPKTSRSKKSAPKAKAVKTQVAKARAPKATLSKASIKAPVKKTPAKSVAKKSSAKKAPPPKPTTKPAVKRMGKTTAKATVKKVTIKAPTTKKSSTPRAATKQVSKPVAKVTAKRMAPKTVTKAAAKPASKSTKDDLRKTIAGLESRMKRADTLTRKSVKALESAVMSLDARTRKDSSTGKAALTRKVNQLSAKLTDMVAKTQAEVNTELKTALNNPTVENLQAALFRADERMSAAEQVQASAIAKVNRHLSAIATAVDSRIEDEAKTRQAAIETISARVDTVETDTAQALSRVGDKIAELSGELTQRGEASELSIREKVSEIALQTQTEFENYRAGLNRRIDDVAQNSANTDTQRLEQSIASLTARLEGLEYAVANPPIAEASPVQMTAPSAPQLSVVPSQAAPLMSAPQALSHEPQLPDAFSPMAQISDAPTAPIIPNPYLTEPVEAAPVITESPEGHHPVEFDPNSYVKTRTPTPSTPPMPNNGPLIDDPLNNEPLRDFTQTQIPAPLPMTDLAALPPIATNGTASPYADPAYADPAYANTDPTMAGLRIGDKSDSKLNLPKLSGRNLRVAALATGVAVVGLIAAKGVFGSSNAPTALPQQTVEQTNLQNETTPVSIPKPDTSAAPIGDYADNKAVTVAPSSEAAKTLNSAAAAGDPVAQFQLGLSYLEQGRTNEGVALVRKSANQNQPAAQYRLAKLYEIGEGVSQDSEIARQLTERAATNGNRIAMHDLALYYAEGRGGVEADLPTAAKWFEKAAERGVVDSQFNLGVLFESGQGIPKNMNDAFVWYSIAAAQGDQFAKTRIDVLKTTLEQDDLVSLASRIKQFNPRKIDEAANGIFRNVEWGKSNNDTSAEISQVKQVQTMLTELGYDIGGADGSIGPKTRSAIINFERVNSLPETGRVNTALVDRLELATGA